VEGTTLIKRRKIMKRGHLTNCHGGLGNLDLTVVFDREELMGRHLNFIHDDVLAPGVSVGVHQHEGDEEYYYFLSGRGVMILDGKRYEVSAGDITAVYPGGSHGLENNAAENLRFLVISVS